MIRRFRDGRQVVGYVGVRGLVTGACVYREELCLVVRIVRVGLIIAREADEIR
jgi:hypothetical protein